MNATDRSGIALVAAGGLGDTVLLAQVLPRFLALRRPGETLSVILRSDAAKMAFLFPPEVEIVPVEFAAIRRRLARRGIFKALAARRFRVVVSADFLRHPELDEALIRACGAPENLAMEPRAWPKYDAKLSANRALYARLYDSGPAHTDKVMRWTAFANWLTGRAGPPPKIGRSLDRLLPPAELEKPTVVIQPFSAVREKQHPPRTYARLIGELPDGYEVIVAGAPGDLERHPEFAPLLSLPGVRFDGSSFEQLAPVLRAAVLVISVDTALMHLAAALGAPVLCLASAAYVGEIVPYAPEIAPAAIRFVYRDMDCRGCLGSCIHPAEDGMFPCVAGTEIDAAIAALHELIATRGAS
jgi:ADP-heptose:LPS heptosyltransferase